MCSLCKYFRSVAHERQRSSWLDSIVTSFFTMDLMVNMFAKSSNWFRSFYTEPANSFDLLIVGVSLASLYMDHQDIESPLDKMIRLIRALKVLKKIFF